MSTPHRPYPSPSPEHETPIDTDGVPDEEQMETADVAERVELSPEEQTNRPEREEPETIADAALPEDR